VDQSLKREFVVRAAVVREGRVASAIWRIWKSRNNDNIYVAPRNIAGAAKITLHANRYCHAAVTNQYARMIHDGGDAHTRRVMVSWQRADGPTQGWITGVSILIAPQFLSPYDVEIDADILAIDAPAPDKAIVIELIFSRSPRGAIRRPPSVGELGSVQLSTGEQVAVMGGIIDFDFVEFRRKAKLTMPLDRVLSLTDLSAPDLRMALMSDPNTDGVLRIFDIGGVSVVAEQ